MKKRSLYQDRLWTNIGKQKRTPVAQGALLLEDSNETVLLSYDRLAQGWAGPPGRLGDSDYVFSMRVTIKAT